MTFLVEINKLITNLYINSLGKKQRNIHGKFANIKVYQTGNGFKTQVSIERRLQSLQGRSHPEHLGLLPEHTHTHTHTKNTTVWNAHALLYHATRNSSSFV